MAVAIAADADRNVYGRFTVLDFPVTASTQIYKNQLVGLTDGYLIGASNSSGVKFLGRAREGVTAVAAGSVSCGVATFGGTIIDVHFTGDLTLNNSAYGLADMYIVNNDTVGPKSVASACFAGTCLRVLDATNKIISLLLTTSIRG